MLLPNCSTACVITLEHRPRSLMIAAIEPHVCPITET